MVLFGRLFLMNQKTTLFIVLLLLLSFVNKSLQWYPYSNLFSHHRSMVKTTINKNNRQQQQQPEQQQQRTKTTTSTTTVFYNSNKDNDKDNDSIENETDDEFQRRMAMVRSLQMSYYKSSSNTIIQTSSMNNNNNGDDDDNNDISKLQTTKGIMTNVPLWRVSWTEVPGRSNVLNVHEPIYTNMFEKILYGPKPWYFGHLFLKNGSKNLININKQNKDKENKDEDNKSKSKFSKYILKSYNDINKDDIYNYYDHTSSAIIGCLLKISDFRRLQDGRLLLLVHAMERFVIKNVHQQIPYSIADIQFIPDLEEIDPTYDANWNTNTTTTTSFLDNDNNNNNNEKMITTITESDIQKARAMSIEDSFQYHDYEYDTEHTLPIPDRIDLHVTEVLGSSIARVLPFCPFSRTIQPPISTSSSLLLSSEQEEQEEEVKDKNNNNKKNKDISSTIVVEEADNNNNRNDKTSLSSSSSSKQQQQEQEQQQQQPLEYQLLEKKILQYPTKTTILNNEFEKLTNDELEYKLWLLINKFLITTRMPVSPVLLSLIPPEITYWPKQFVLLKISEDLAQLRNENNTFGTISSNTNLMKNFTTSSSTETSTTSTTTTSSNNNNSNKQSQPRSWDHDYVTISKDYPSYRRQIRLSYTAVHLLESTNVYGYNKEDNSSKLRQELLEIPSTKERLLYVIKGFELFFSRNWGEFQ